MEQHDSTEAPVCGCCRRVPISYLALDLDEPVEGWLSLFAQRGIEVAEDHLGRPSVGRRVLSHLLDEQREREARLASERAETAAAARPDVGVGVPALEGATAYESLLAPDAETRRRSSDTSLRRTSSRKRSRPVVGIRRRSGMPSDGGRRRNENREREGDRAAWIALRFVRLMVRVRPRRSSRHVPMSDVPRVGGREPGRRGGAGGEKDDRVGLAGEAPCFRRSAAESSQRSASAWTHELIRRGLLERQTNLRSIATQNALRPSRLASHSMSCCLLSNLTQAKPHPRVAGLSRGGARP